MGVYQDLGVTPLVNAWGTVTLVGGSLMEPETVQAMADASRAFVDLEDLAHRAGRSIAGLLGADAACITSGAAAGITVAAAGCASVLSSRDPSPHASADRRAGAPATCLMLRSHRNRYDRAVGVAGLAVTEIDAPDPTLDDVARSITDRTALFLYFAESETRPGSLPLRDVASVLARAGVPLVVDAAAEIPPRSNIVRFLSDGADLLVVSGGKAIRGPQSSGMVLGGRRLIEACQEVAFPHHGIGRGMKVDKETIAGLVKAVELFARRDEGAQAAFWEDASERIADGLAGSASLEVRRGFIAEPGIQPATIPRVFVKPVRRSAAQLRDRLRAGDPPVVVGLLGEEIVVNPQCLDEAEVPIVIGSIIEAA